MKRHAPATEWQPGLRIAARGTGHLNMSLRHDKIYLSSPQAGPFRGGSVHKATTRTQSHAGLPLAQPNFNNQRAVLRTRRGPVGPVGGLTAGLRMRRTALWSPG